MPSNDAGRPAYNSDDVRQRAAALLCVELGAESSTPDAIVSVARALGRSSNTFDLAKALDGDGWSIDDDVLDILRDSDGHHSDAHRAAVAEWVESRRIRPLRDVGEAVSFEVRGEQLDGEITRVDAAQATYTIYVPSLGHVRAGVGTNGIIIPFEQVHGLCPAPETFELEAQGALA